MSSDPAEPLKEKTLILDANILVRAVLGRRVLSLLETFADQVSFLAPEVAFADVRRHLPKILIDRGLPGEDVEILLDRVVAGRLTLIITPVPQDAYADFESDARRRLAKRDEQDWHFIALALKTGSPIWTEDQDFFGRGIATWTTDRIEIYLTAASVSRIE